MDKITDIKLNKLNGKVYNEQPYQNAGSVVDYALSKMGAGFLKSVEGVYDLAAGGVSMLAGNISGNENLTNWGKQQFLTDFMDYESIDREFNPSKGVKILGDASQGIGNSMLSMFAGAGVGGIAKAIGKPLSQATLKAISYTTLGLSAAGNATSEAAKKTGDVGAKEFAYGALAGLTEVGTEALGDKLNLGSGAVRNAITGSFAKDATSALAHSGARNIIGRVLGDFVDEAVEEMLSEMADPLWLKMTGVDPDASTSFGDVAYAGLIGGLSGVMMGSSQRNISSVGSLRTGSRIVAEGKTDTVLNTAKAILENGADLDISEDIMRDLKANVDALNESLAKTGGSVSTVRQKALLGNIAKLNPAAMFNPMLQNEALRILDNADEVAKYMSTFLVDANGNPVTITAKDLTSGITADPSDTKAYRKQISNALTKNSYLQGAAIMSFAGKLQMQTDEYIKFMAEHQVTNDDQLQMFREQASEAQKEELGRILDIEDWNNVSAQTVNEKLMGKGEMLNRMIQSATKAKEAAKGEAKKAPSGFSKRNADGTYDIGDGYRVVKSGETYRVYNTATDSITRELSVKEVNDLVKQKTNGEEIELQNKVKETADKLAREYVPGYAKASETVKRAVRMTITQGYAEGVDPKAISFAARLALETGVNILFDKDALKINDNGRFKYANGYYDMKNSVYVNPKGTRTNFAQTVLSHEMGHWVFDNSPKDIQAILLHQAMEGLTDEQKAEVIKTYEQYKDRPEVIYDEIQAKFAEEVMTDDALWEKLLSEDESLKKKVPAFIRRWQERTKLKEAKTAADIYRLVFEQQFREMVKANKGNNAYAEINKLHAQVLEGRHNLEYEEKHKKDLAERYDEKSAVIPLAKIQRQMDAITKVWREIGGEIDSDFLKKWDAKKGKDNEFKLFKDQSGYKYNVELSTMCKKGIALFEAIDTIVRKEIMSRLDTDALETEERQVLYDVLKSEGFQIPCAICYVEQARKREGTIIKNFLNGNEATDTGLPKLGWNQVLTQIEEKMAAAGQPYKFDSFARDMTTEEYVPKAVNMTEEQSTAYYQALMEIANQAITDYNESRKGDKKFKPKAQIKSADPKAFAEVLKGNLPANLVLMRTLAFEPDSRLRIADDYLYSSVVTKNLAGNHHMLYKLFNMQGGTAGYKLKQTPIVYMGDILGKSFQPGKVRNEGGIRNQSNSDLQMYLLLDMIQMYADLSAKGYYLHAYTKVPAEIKILGLSGAKINASAIPSVVIYHNADGSVDVTKTMENAGLDEKGRPIYDNVEGIDIDDALMMVKDPEYSKNVGIICIGYSDNHIRALLDDRNVQLIIGFHDKTNDPTKRYVGAKYAKNYNGLNEATDENGKTQHVTFGKYLTQAEKMFGYQEKTDSHTKDTVEFNGRTYSWGKAYDGVPKLAAALYLADMASKNWHPAYETFAGHENYYKLLGDFTLYNSEGKYAPHRKVALNIPDAVPVLRKTKDGVKTETVPTKDYIKAELISELQTIDSISSALADDSDDGILAKMVKGINEVQKAKKAEGRYSISDQNYMDAVNNGDMKTAQKMVDEAAKKAGFSTQHLYHGTSSFGFTSIDVGSASDDSISFFATDKQIVAASYMPYYEDAESEKYYDDARRIGKPDAAAVKPLNIGMGYQKIVDVVSKQDDRFVGAKPATEDDFLDYFNRFSRDEVVSGAEYLLKDELSPDEFNMSNADRAKVKAMCKAIMEAKDANTFEAWKKISEQYKYEIIPYSASDVAATIAEARIVDGLNRVRYMSMAKDLLVANGNLYSLRYMVDDYNRNLGGKSIGIYDLYARQDNQLEIYGQGSNWNRIPLGDIQKRFDEWAAANGIARRENTPATTRDIARYAKDNGYRSVVFYDIYDTGGFHGAHEISDVYAFFYPESDVKSADPVTYDENGDVIPVSERFNTSNNDIRYALPSDKEYMQAVESKDEAKMREILDQAAKEAGYDSPILYHGTRHFGFTEFDTPVIYTSTDRTVSAHYAGDQNYAFVRDIGKGYKGGDSIKDIISDAETVYGTKYHVATAEEKQAAISKVLEDSKKIEDRLEPSNIRPDNLPDDVSSALDVVEALFYDFNAEYAEDDRQEYVDMLKWDAERYDDAKRTISEYVDENSGKLDKRFDNYLRFLRGFEAGDAAIDIIYRALKILENDNILVNENGNYNVPSELRKAMDAVHNIGAYQLYGNLGSNPLVFDANGAQFWGIKVPQISDEYMDTDSIVKWAREHGYTSVVMKNIYDYGDKADNYVFFDSSQVKSADLVTYDDQGNVIPPSKRFDSSKADVRYSMPSDADYMKAVESDDMKAAGKMVREAARANGYDSPLLYHGSDAFGFTKFDLGMSQDTIFATNWEMIAATYTKGYTRTIDSAKNPDRFVEQRSQQLRSAAEEASKFMNDTFGDSYMDPDNILEEFSDAIDDLFDTFLYDYYEEKVNHRTYPDEDWFYGNSKKGIKIRETIDRFHDELNQYYAELGNVQNGNSGGIYSLYGKLGNAFIVDANDSMWNNIPVRDKQMFKDTNKLTHNTREIADWAKKAGYDSVYIKNVKDNGEYGAPFIGDVYIFFSENQVKSADPVVYDDEGKVIPLSERFNSANDDIRYSMPTDADYMKAVNSNNMEEAQKMVDEAAKKAGARTNKNGKPIVYYHGTKATFNSFDMNKTANGMLGIGAYFTPSKQIADAYGTKTMSVYIMTDRLLSLNGHKITVDQVKAILDKYHIPFDESIGFYSDSIENWVSKHADFQIIGDITTWIRFFTDDVSNAQIQSDFQRIFGFDGIESGNIIALWDNKLVKSADPITYDDQGKVIPLSQRFDSANQDVRYSLPEDDLKEAKRIKKLAEQQSERATERLQKSRKLVQDNTAANKATNRVLDLAQKLKEYVTKRKYVSSSVLANPLLDAWAKELGKIKYRSDVRKASARKILASFSQFYNENNDVLKDYLTKEENGLGFDENVLGALELLNANLSNEEMNFRPLNAEELRAAEVILGAADALFRNFDTVFVDGKRQLTQEIAEKELDILRQGKDRDYTKFFGAHRAIERYLKGVSDPRSVIRSMEHYNPDGLLTHLYKNITDGETAAQKQNIVFLTPFEEFLKKHKQYGKRLVQDKITLTGTEGDFELNVGQAIALYELTKRQQAWRGLVESGVAYKDDNGLIKSARLFGEGKYTEEDLEEKAKAIRENVGSKLTAEDMEFIGIVEDFFNKQSKAVKEAADIENYGYTNALEDFYYPIKRAESTIATSFSSVTSIMSDIAAMNTFSFNKNTVKNARNQVFLNGVYDTVQQHARLMSIYAHMYKALESFSRVLNRNVGTSTEVTSVRKYLQEHVWMESEQYLKELMADIQGVKNEKFGDRLWGGLRGAFAKAQLGANAKVILGQLASLPTAMIRLSPASIAYGITHKVDFSELDKYSDWAMVRNHEQAIVKAEGVVDKVGKVGDFLSKPIQWTDRLTIGFIWNACQKEIERTKGLAIGTEENKIAAAKLLEEVGRDTQPNYTNTERSRMMRGNQFVRTLTMFTSVPLKQVSRFIEAAGMYKVALESKDAVKIRGAGRRLARTLAALIVTNLFYCMIGQFFKWLYKKERKNRAGEEISFAEDYFTDVAGTTLGMFPVVKNVFDYFSKGYDLSSFDFDVINDLLSSTGEIVTLVEKAASGQELDKSDFGAPLRSTVYSASQLAGIPTKNIMNTITGLFKRFSPETAYAIQSFTTDKNYRSDLAKYADDEGMANLLMDMYTRENNGAYTDAAKTKLLELYKQGYDVLPREVSDTVSYSYTDENGDTQTAKISLNKSQKEQFRSIYSQSNAVIDQMVTSTAFQKLDEEDQAKAIRSVNNAYYAKAKDEVTGSESQNSLAAYFPRDIGKFAVALAGMSGIEADTDKQGNPISGTKKTKTYKYLTSSGLTRNEALYVMAIKGYTLKNLPIAEANARKMLLSYILSLPVTQAEKAEIAKRCGFTVKGNRIVNK